MWHATRAAPRVHMPGKHLLPIRLQFLQFCLLIGRQQRGNLVVDSLEDLGSTVHFVMMDRLKLGFGIGQNRLDLRLLISGQIQLVR
jgi:hypothetical protein